MVVDINSEISFDLLVYSFCLSIGLGMVCRGWVSFDVQHLIEIGDEFGNKLRSSVADDLFGESVEFKYMVPK